MQELLSILTFIAFVALILMVDKLVDDMDEGERCL